MRLGSKVITDCGVLTHVVKHDVSDTLELAAAMRSENRTFDLPDGSGRLVATIDMALVNEVMEMTGLNILDGSQESSDFLFKMLDGDWKKFQVTDGQTLGKPRSMI